MIVADTGAIVALVDADDRNHSALRGVFEEDPDAWILPWAILPEVDYLLLKTLGRRAQRLFVEDVAEGRYRVEWPDDQDLLRASEVDERYDDLELGLVDATVLAVAERLGADAIATLDLRDFGALQLPHGLRLLPRDL